MTVGQFLDILTRPLPPGWRRGQAAFNSLRAVRPGLAAQVVGTPADPFHDNRQMPTFLDWVVVHWADNDSTVEPW